MSHFLAAVVLTDIEGTTSSISFVKDVLFPYARRALPAFLKARGRDPEVMRWLDSVASEIGASGTDACIAEVLQGWIDQDRKHTALKALQGMIWQAGYENRDFSAHVYADAVVALQQWHAAGIPLFVYSSGSVAAQTLFFGHSDAGDLRPLFAGHFDTEIGGKREAESYHRIAARIGTPPSEIVFLSDVVEELDAARDAGLQTVLIDRREDYPQPRLGAESHDHPRETSFASIELREASKA
ncbi:MAG TPA: acireductone synthase [Aquimonas sp.]|nr:acireductone synthase [Xanthomonadales bacterium]HRD72101.1 acireductone synthase [Aquimonas sp.]HRF54286.1 acireductone synthase [Aquimonas sp.]